MARPDLVAAAERARRPVPVPWREPLAGFVAGFLAALLPAAFVTRMAASLVPFAGPVLRGWPALVFAFLTAACVGLATAVCAAARATRA